MKKLFTLFALVAMALTIQANELTVAEGNETNKMVPIYGMYTDWNGTMGQMIYPEAMLSDMVGGKINALKFYSPDIKFSGVTLQLSLKVVDQEGYETAEAVTGATVVASATPTLNETEMVFEFDEPFDYAGGNLMVEVLVTAKGNWATTEFYGMNTENTPSLYCYYWSNWGDPSFDIVAFLPKATFTYEAAQTPVEPTEKTGAPVFHGYTEDGIHAYFVEILETEPSVIYYRVQYPDGTWTEWAEYEEILSFEGDGKYRIEAYAVAEGKAQSEQIAYEFVVAPRTGIDEMTASKEVAGIRYFNLAGQEMQQANGLTIVVTTYTDGTTSAVKVVK